MKLVREHFEEIFKYFEKWKIKINVAKTEFIVFSKKRETPKNIYISNTETIPKDSINRKSNLNKANKLTLYKAIIRPILTYASPIWSNTYKSNINKLEIIQINITKVDPRTKNTEIRDTLKLETIWERIKAQTTKFYTTQVKTLEIPQNTATYNNQIAPFKIRYKLPHHILL